MSDSDQQKAEELLNSSKDQSRMDTDPADTSTDDAVSLEAAVVDAYEALDAGDLPQNLTVRDEHLAALFAGLDDADELADVGHAAQDALDGYEDVDVTVRAGVLRLLLRVGLREVSPEVLSEASSARVAFETPDEDELEF